MPNLLNPRNPFYFLFLRRKTKKFLNHKITQENDYILIHFSPTKVPMVSILGKQLELSEHHLSIYEKSTVEINEKAVLSPFHHTMTFKGNWSVRVYFDGYGHYIACIVKKDKKIIAVSANIAKEDRKNTALLASEEEEIKKISEICTYDSMVSMFTELEKEHRVQKEKLAASLQPLVELSKGETGIQNKKYLILLEQTILIAREANALSFYPETSMLNLLLKQKTAIEEKLKSTQKQVVNVPLPEPVLLEEKDEVSTLAVASQPSTRAELEALFDKSLQPGEPLVQYIKTRQGLINQLWAICSRSIEDLDFALDIFKKQEELENKRTEYLLNACRENNVEVAGALFNEEKDIGLTNGIVRLAIAEGYTELFDLFCKKKSLKFSSIFSRLVSVPQILKKMPPHVLKIIDMKFPYLYFAYISQQLPMFYHLLNHHGEDPNQKDDINGFPLLFAFITEAETQDSSKRNRCLEFVKALLESKADCNVQITQSHCYFREAGRSNYRQLQPNPCLGRTPLFQAAYTRNEAAVELLLGDEYQADTRIATKNGECAFFAAVYPMEKERPLNKKIIQKMLQRGRTIDEKIGLEGVTPLFRACHCINKEAVEMLLELGANPLENQRYVFNELLMQTNPLIMAIKMATIDDEKEPEEAFDIVNIILTHLHLKAKKSILERKEILRAFMHCVHYVRRPKEGQYQKVFDSLKQLLRTVYHQEALLFYENHEYENACLMFEGFYQAGEGWQDPEDHSVLYDFSCCLLNQGKIKEEQRHLKDATQLFKSAKEHIGVCLEMRQSIREQNLVRQAIEKLREINLQLEKMNNTNVSLRSPASPSPSHLGLLSKSNKKEERQQEQLSTSNKPKQPTKTFGSAIIGGGAGYFIGKVLASTIVAGSSASLFVAFSTFGGAGLLVLVDYYMMGGRSDCCSSLFHRRSSLSSTKTSPDVSRRHLVQS